MSDNPFLTDEIIEKMARTYCDARFGADQWSTISESVRPSFCSAIRASLLAVLPDLIECAARVAEGESAKFDYQEALANGEDIDYGINTGRRDAARALRSFIPPEQAPPEKRQER